MAEVLLAVLFTADIVVPVTGLVPRPCESLHVTRDVSAPDAKILKISFLNHSAQ